MGYSFLFPPGIPPGSGCFTGRKEQGSSADSGNLGGSRGGVGVGHSQACTTGLSRVSSWKQSRRTRDVDTFLYASLTESSQDNGTKMKQTGARKEDLGKLILSARN